MKDDKTQQFIFNLKHTNTKEMLFQAVFPLKVGAEFLNYDSIQSRLMYCFIIFMSFVSVVTF